VTGHLRWAAGRSLPADNHVHSEWSYDTDDAASMRRSCERALELGVPAVSFTEHLDFTTWSLGDAATNLTSLRRGICDLDVDGYLECIEDCRRRFPGLKILSGIEAGEPHLVGESLGGVVRRGAFDRVLGSLHALVLDDRIVPLEDTFSILGEMTAIRSYFAELLNLIDGSDVFEVLAHVDYPRRWIVDWDEAAFEEEYRAVFSALATTGRVLEMNTYTPLASARLIRWWRAEGGRTVSFGSDAHVPHLVGDKFDLAVAIVEDAGFTAAKSPEGFWTSGSPL